jgi:hypothetical protein
MTRPMTVGALVDATKKKKEVKRVIDQTILE